MRGERTAQVLDLTVPLSLLLRILSKGMGPLPEEVKPSAPQAAGFSLPPV